MSKEKVEAGLKTDEDTCTRTIATNNRLSLSRAGRVRSSRTSTTGRVSMRGADSMRDSVSRTSASMRASASSKAR